MGPRTSLVVMACWGEYISTELQYISKSHVMKFCMWFSFLDKWFLSNIRISPDIAAEWLSLLLPVWEVPGSSLSSQISYSY